MLYSFIYRIKYIIFFINSPNFIVRLPFFLEIMGNICMIIIFFLVDKVTNFKIN